MPPNEDSLYHIPAMTITAPSNTRYGSWSYKKPIKNRPDVPEAMLVGTKFEIAKPKLDILANLYIQLIRDLNI